jgi:hypothetical protein
VGYFEDVDVIGVVGDSKGFVEAFGGEGVGQLLVDVDIFFFGHGIY